MELLPFAWSELRSAGIEVASVDHLLFQGQYPPLYDRDLDPLDWYGDYIRTYVERDVRQIIAVQDLKRAAVRMLGGK